MADAPRLPRRVAAVSEPEIRTIEHPYEAPMTVYTWRCPCRCGWSFTSGNNYAGTTADAIAKFEGQLRQLGHELSHVLGLQALVGWLSRRL